MGIFTNLFGGRAAKKAQTAKPKSKAKAAAPPAPRRQPTKGKTNIERRFTLHGRLGQGSMSKVWRATDNLSGKAVCLKVLDKSKTDALKKRFVGLIRPDEGEVAMALNHPNVVRTFEWGQTSKNEEFLVMELIEGVGLNFLIDTKSHRLLGHEPQVLIHALEGLDHFHKQGFIHRDICPRNIMMTNDGVVKLIDFGLAVPNTAEFRKPGNRTGTANYMAPELIKRGTTDQRIDLFSMGVTAYETFTGGTHPWDVTAQSLQAMLHHINSAGKNPKELRPDLDGEVVRILVKSIDRDPRLRYQTCRDFIRDLQNLIGEVVEEETDDEETP